MGSEKKDMACGVRLAGSDVERVHISEMDRGKIGNTRILSTAAGPKAIKDIENGMDQWTREL